MPSNLHLVGTCGGVARVFVSIIPLISLIVPDMDTILLYEAARLGEREDMGSIFWANFSLIVKVHELFLLWCLLSHIVSTFGDLDVTIFIT